MVKISGLQSLLVLAGLTGLGTSLAFGQQQITLRNALNSLELNVSSASMEYRTSKYQWYTVRYRPISFSNCSVVWEETETQYNNDPPENRGGQSCTSVTTSTVYVSLSGTFSRINLGTHSDGSYEEAQIWSPGRKIRIEETFESTSRWRDGSADTKTTRHSESQVEVQTIRYGTRVIDNREAALGAVSAFQVAIRACGGQVFIK